MLNTKYEAIVKNGMWYFTDFLDGKKAISTKWVYKLKCKLDGNIDCYKVKLVAKRYAQEKGNYFDGSFCSNLLYKYNSQSLCIESSS